MLSILESATLSNFNWNKGVASADLDQTQLPGHSLCSWDYSFALSDECFRKTLSRHHIYERTRRHELSHKYMILYLST